VPAQVDEIMRILRFITVALFIAALSMVILHHRLQGFIVSGQGQNLATPIEVVASDNSYSTKVGITWAAVRGATSYRIFRNTTNDTASATDLGTTPAASFFNTNGVGGQNYFYWVRAENGNVVGGFSEPDQGARANGVINGPVGPLNPPPAPLGNQVTAAKAFLGKALFWDEQLSSTRTVACGTCHFATSGGSDARSLVNNPRSTNPGADGVFNTADDVFASPGVMSNNSDGTFNWSSVYGFNEQVTGRKSRSYINAGYSNSLFWDGRETQVLPIRFPERWFCMQARLSRARRWDHQSAAPRWRTTGAIGLMLRLASPRPGH